ncbi:hypothetical protein AB1Y20_008942 [Prymnesium parvum]|uniref:Uncharacterized protein n=1 Tax=Prymnesium parvum TaxID=97485 RepID=A0AB34K0Q2_PRYPA
MAPLAAWFVGWLCAFPTLHPPPETLSITSPVDGRVYSTSSSRTTTLPLLYHTTPRAERICLHLSRAPPAPLPSQPAEEFRTYAQGCFAIGQPVRLENLIAGNYSLHASARGAAGDLLCTAAPVGFGVEEGTAEFVPSYEWRPVAAGQSVVAGLELQLDLAASRRRARIPPTWRLQVYLGREHGGFFRMDVQRDTPVGAIERAAAAQAARGRAQPREVCAALWAGLDRLAPSDTVEGAMLFQKQGELKIEVRSCERLPGAESPPAGGA